MDMDQLEDIVSKRRLPADAETPKKKRRRVKPTPVLPEAYEGPSGSGLVEVSHRARSSSPVRVQPDMKVRDLYIARCFHITGDITVLVGLRLTFKQNSYFFNTVLLLTNKDSTVCIPLKTTCLDLLAQRFFLLKYGAKTVADIAIVITDCIIIEAMDDSQMLQIKPVSKESQILDELIQAKVQDPESVEVLTRRLYSEEVVKEMLCSMVIKRNELLELLRLKDCIQEYASVCVSCELAAREIFSLYVQQFVKSFQQPCLFYSTIKPDCDEMLRLKQLLYTRMNAEHHSVKRITLSDCEKELYTFQNCQLHKSIEAEVLLRYDVVKNHGFSTLLESFPWLALKEKPLID